MYPEVNRGMPVLPTRLCRKGCWTHRGDQCGADQAGDHACKVGCQEFSCRELERGTEQGTQGHLDHSTEVDASTLGTPLSLVTLSVISW